MKTSPSFLPFLFLLPIAAAIFALSPTSMRAETSSRSSDAAKLKAKWIWQDGQDCKAYNQMIVARKTFLLDQPRTAVLRITADTFYRLMINGRWVNDGPARSWPEHFQYDVLDVTSYLHAGENEISIIARYYGVGDFHHVPKQAGLLAQLDVTAADGQTTSVVSDGTWEAAKRRP